MPMTTHRDACLYNGSHHHPDNPQRGRWWVVRLDTGDGVHVCGRHIAAAFDHLGNPGENYGHGWHVQDTNRTAQKAVVS